jgi:hypothetical protein
LKEPLPSASNKVGVGEFAVGSYKEFKLREELVGLIDKYNKKFYSDGGPTKGEAASKQPTKASNGAILSPR